ncbi:MAG: cyclomaltodextrinase N-terminal domain-containing protein [Bacteroidetes bacterium]|uniref:alpha-amylase family glycosyl hydrolase n=1 Tax=Phnomibacter sp. TaxID=2836217 RepID=UPI002FDD78B9|nr:cyclomaltodextrinase N-terminal domain-containing protein [Bacteroidota bacterium]
MKKITSLLCVLLLLSWQAFAQKAQLYPTHWWTGMKWNQVQLLIHQEGINASAATVQLQYPGVTIKKVTRAESPNYLVVDISIAATAKPGVLNFKVKSAGKTQTIPFTLKARTGKSGKDFAHGVTSQDLVYLIMPDRFANGDASNDRIPGYKDTICDRSNPSAHHGGDIQGVINNIGYLKDMGVTSIWMCPVTENDMPWKQEPAGAISGYHGYWITNHYAIDKRYGGADAYKKLVRTAHAQGMKIIQDAVYNHVGDEHFLFKDKPFADMFNNWPAYTGSNHREEALFGAYASQADKKVMLEGWFTPHLPDLNLRNPYMANFMIQNAIWSTEEFMLDGWRVDTYKYCDEQFMNNVNAALLKEYPTLSIFGEAWANSVPGSAYFTKNNMQVPFKHNLPGTTDFPMQSAMLSAINQPFGWTEGLNKLMMTLSQDVLYQDPKLNCIFLDNHDVDRFMTMIGGDEKKYYMGIGLLLTQRGIPQLYFGTEIQMKNDDVQGDGKKRNDFPGGFAGDAQNKFVASGRNAAENAAYEYVKKLANFRKQSKALTLGSTTDFLPQDGVYVYFRKHGNETVMCIINQNQQDKTIALNRFAEMTGNYQQATNVITGSNAVLQGEWRIPAQTMWVMQLK